MASTVTSAVASISERLGLNAGSWDIVPCGSGGQTSSYRATSDAMTICIKTAPAGSLHLGRESLMLARLASPHIPRLILDGADEGFVIEEFIPGPALHEVAPHQRLAALPKIVTGLHAATAACMQNQPAILHRDLKPANLRLSGSRLVVLDFGSAEFEGSRDPDVVRRESTKLGRGTHHAQPLQQLLGSPSQDRRVDVFAAACIVFWIMTGRAPYQNVYGGEAVARRAYADAEEELDGALRQWPAPIREKLIDALRVEADHRPSTLSQLAYAVIQHFPQVKCSMSR